DVEELRELWDKYAPDAAREQFDAAIRSLIPLQPFKTARELTEQEEGYAHFDELAEVPDHATIDELFAERFFFGCEAEDPGTAWGFDPRRTPRLRSMLGSDIGHWDVSDVAGVIAESWELVEDGLLTLDDYRDFTFTNAATFYAATNPRFFDG